MFCRSMTLSNVRTGSQIDGIVTFQCPKLTSDAVNSGAVFKEFNFWILNRVITLVSWQPKRYWHVASVVKFLVYKPRLNHWFPYFPFLRVFKQKTPAVETLCLPAAVKIFANPSRCLTNFPLIIASIPFKVSEKSSFLFVWFAWNLFSCCCRK